MADPNILDVVTVPDFTADRHKLFEYRTLFFLGSWMETQHLHTKCRLHLACIGEPPSSVRYLADKAEASITIHEPFILEGFTQANTNKFRGFEVDGDGANVLLIDTDVFFMKSMDGLLDLGECISVGPSYMARITARYWEKIYAAMDMTPPTERIVANVHKTRSYPNDMNPELKEENAAMYPYYNTGVLMVPRKVDLVSLWKEHVLRVHQIAQDFPEDERKQSMYNGSDQTGFATAVEYLKQQGASFTQLPEVYNVIHLQVLSKSITFEEMAIFHYITFLGMARNAGRSKDKTLRDKIMQNYSYLQEEGKGIPSVMKLLQMIETIRKKHVVPTFEACGYERPF